MDTPRNLSDLSKEELLAHIEKLYAEAKPHQDAVADSALGILTHSREVFRRIITKHLPNARFTETRVVTELSCGLNCLGAPAHELARRLNKFSADGINIVRVEFDELQSRFLFHAHPHGYIQENNSSRDGE